MSIQFNQVSYIYQQGTPYEFEAIKDISLTLEQGKYYAIIGQTGSGKSTLIQHLNALLKPTTGSVNINGLEVTSKTKDKHLRYIRILSISNVGRTNEKNSHCFHFGYGSTSNYFR